MSACVLLVKALGGGWNASALPSADELDRKGEFNLRKGEPTDSGPGVAE
jgi:hypothetical protein